MLNRRNTFHEHSRVSNDTTLAGLNRRLRKTARTGGGRTDGRNPVSSTDRWRVSIPAEAGDETFVVLEGEVTIDFLDLKQSKTFRAGDIFAWSQGSRTLWHTKGGFKKFYVVANARVA